MRDLFSIKLQAFICPELSEVHVECKIHKLVANLPDGEDIERHADRHGRPPVPGSHPAVVANLTNVMKVLYANIYCF